MSDPFLVQVYTGEDDPTEEEIAAEEAAAQEATIEFLRKLADS